MKNLIGPLFNLTVWVLLAGSGLAYAEAVGHVQFVNGVVQLTTATGQTRGIQKGDAVSEGDTLASAPAASAQIRMRDGGIVAMRPDTRFKVDSFKFSGKQDGSERSFFSLLKGGFRAVTGLVGQLNKSSYRVTTPQSTIGIRGTDHEVFVVVPGSALSAVAHIGTYNRVNVGETSMTTSAGTISILPNQMGFVAAADQMPQLLPVNPDLFTAMPGPLAQGVPGFAFRSSVVDSSLLGMDTGAGSTLPPSMTFQLRPITATLITQGIGITGAPNQVVSVITF